MTTVTQTAQRSKSTFQPVGEVTVASPFMDPERSLGPYGRDQVRDFRLAHDAGLPPFEGRDTGDLHDYCEEHWLRLVHQANVGRMHGMARYIGWHRFLIVRDEA